MKYDVHPGMHFEFLMVGWCWKQNQKRKTITITVRAWKMINNSDKFQVAGGEVIKTAKLAVSTKN